MTEDGQKNRDFRQFFKPPTTSCDLPFTNKKNRVKRWTLNPCLLLYIYIYIYIYMCVCVCVCVYLLTSQDEQDVKKRSIFKRNLTGFNSEFSFTLTGCLNKVKEPSLPYYIYIYIYIYTHTHSLPYYIYTHTQAHKNFSDWKLLNVMFNYLCTLLGFN